MARKKFNEESEFERVFTVPLRREWLKQTRKQRSPRAVRAIQDFMVRHMHAKDVKISEKLNEAIWKRGTKKPPASIKVKAKREKTGLVFARLPEEIELKKEEKKGKLGVLKEKIGEKKGAAEAPKPEPRKEAVSEKPAEAKPEAKKA
jgi:large subunit ribosomal protein L31e